MPDDEIFVHALIALAECAEDDAVELRYKLS